MRCFKSIATLIRTKRLQHPKAYSQSELSHLLGYKNGQFISNVERALCNIPLKMLSRVSDVLDVDAQELKDAILADHDATLNNYLKLDKNADIQTLPTSNNSQENTVAAVGEYNSSNTFKMSSNS